MRGAPWVFIRGERVGVGRPLRTDRVQTILDLAAKVPTDLLLTMLSEAIGRQGVRPAEILEALAEVQRHPQRRLLEEVLAQVSDGVRSPLERRYRQQVERAHGLPTARRQQSPIGAGDADAWYDDFGLLVELDGKAFHEGQQQFRDLERDNRHALVALTTLRYGWDGLSGR